MASAVLWIIWKQSVFVDLCSWVFAALCSVWRAGCVRGSPPQCCNSGFLFNAAFQSLSSGAAGQNEHLFWGAVSPPEDWKALAWGYYLSRRVHGGLRNKSPAGGEDVFRWKVLDCVMCHQMKSQRKLQLNASHVGKCCCGGCSGKLHNGISFLAHIWLTTVVGLMQLPWQILTCTADIFIF